MIIPMIAAILIAGGGSEDLSLESLHDADRRVAVASWRLLRSNAGLCERSRMGMGWLLHSAYQYKGDSLSYYQQNPLIDISLPIILVVPPYTPAENAGLREGDQLLAINSKSLSYRPAAAGYGHMSRQLDEIDRGLMNPEPHVKIIRGDQIIDLPLNPEAQCAVTVQVEASEAANARADGKVISLDWGLVTYAETESELAILIGHELAHVISYNDDYSAWDRAVEATPRGLFRREHAADRLGLYLAARAGYDVSGAADFWRRFGRDNLRARWTQWGHPSANSRADALEAVIADIAAKQRAGQELLP